MECPRCGARAERAEQKDTPRDRLRFLCEAERWEFEVEIIHLGNDEQQGRDGRNDADENGAGGNTAV